MLNLNLFERTQLSLQIHCDGVEILQCCEVKMLWEKPWFQQKPNKTQMTGERVTREWSSRRDTDPSAAGMFWHWALINRVSVLWWDWHRLRGQENTLNESKRRPLPCSWRRTHVGQHWPQQRLCPWWEFTCACASEEQSNTKLTSICIKAKALLCLHSHFALLKQIFTNTCSFIYTFIKQGCLMPTFRMLQ